MQRQYLYFCTSNASKLSSAAAAQIYVCQCRRRVCVHPSVDVGRHMYACTCSARFNACVGASRRECSLGAQLRRRVRTQFTCFTACVGATRRERSIGARVSCAARAHSVYLHYWYKSTNIDADACRALRRRRTSWRRRCGRRFLLLSLLALLVQKNYKKKSTNVDTCSPRRRQRRSWRRGCGTR